jgi:hypothetical protein
VLIDLFCAEGEEEILFVELGDGDEVVVFVSFDLVDLALGDLADDHGGYLFLGGLLGQRCEGKEEE